jgi:hypothetical protein
MTWIDSGSGPGWEVPEPTKTLAEPANGTPVVTQRYGTYTVWIREDELAKGQEDPKARWFSGIYDRNVRWENLIEEADVYFLQPAMINGRVLR